MKILLPVVENPDTCLLFIAPTAWGKTSLIIDLFIDGNRNYLYLSPLRAIANEFYERVYDRVGNQAHLLTSHKETKAYFSKEIKKDRKKIIILTPELIQEQFLDLIMAGTFKRKWLVFFDEFHLFYHWGRTFRPLLEEVYLAVASRNINFVALTATFDLNYLSIWRRDIIFSFSNAIIINLGNHQFKRKPKLHCVFPLMLRSQFINYFKIKLNFSNSGIFLYFCKYRNEIDQWLSYCSRNNILAIGCKGGEVLNFYEKLKKTPSIKVIFATSALGHGVNLKKVDNIFIGYQVNNLDFWVQMTGRGGRNGEKFWLYTFDKYYTKRTQRLWALSIVALNYIYLIIWNSLKMLWLRR